MNSMNSTFMRLMCAVLVTLFCTFVAQAQDKPRWAIKGVSDINKKRTNETYKFVKFENFGPEISSVRKDARKNLPDYFAAQFGYNADDARLKMLNRKEQELKGLTPNDPEGDKDAMIDYEVNFVGPNHPKFYAKLVDEYIQYDENVDGTFDYTLYQLYAVATREGVVPTYDDFSFDRGYNSVALVKSIVPGFGQYYKGQNTKAYCIWGGEVVCVATALMCDHRARMALKDRKDQGYKPGDIEWESFHSKHTSWRNFRNIAIAGAVGLYVYNLLDAAISKGPRQVVVKKAKPVETAFAPSLMYDPSTGLTPALGFTVTF